MNTNINEIWAEALEILKNEVSDIGYTTYIEKMVPRFVNNDTICFLALSDYHIEVCNNKYLDLIENTISYITKKRYILEFESKDLIQTVPLNNVESTQKEDIKINKKNIIKKITSNLNPKYTFDNYIVGSNNKFAHAAAISLSQSLVSPYNPLYIYGGVGLGKTHLMHAIGNEINKNFPNLNIIATTSELFTNEFVNSILNDKRENFRNKYRNIDVLLIDDIQFLIGKEKSQEEFFHTFNALFQSGKQIILTSEKSPKELLLEERLKTRFEMGLIVDIGTPDYETRLAILRQKTELERYIIDDEVLVKIASKVNSNIRELEGAFNKLMAYSVFTKSELTDEIVDDTIEAILVRSSKELTSKLIMQVVSKFFNIKVSDMISPKKSIYISKPRQIAMYLCRELADLSFPTIGKDFGGRDHSTVLHAYGKINDEYNNNEEFKNLVNEIKKKLNFAKKSKE